MSGNLGSSGQQGGHWLNTAQPADREAGRARGRPLQSPAPASHQEPHICAHTAQPSPSDTPAPTVDCDIFIEVSTRKETGGIHSLWPVVLWSPGSSEPGLGWPAVGVAPGRGRGSVGSGQASPWGSFRAGWHFRAGGQHQAEPEWAPVLRACTSLRCLGLRPPAVTWVARCPLHLTGLLGRRSKTQAENRPWQV